MPALKLTLNFDGLSPTLFAGTTGIKCSGVLCSHTVSKEQFWHLKIVSYLRLKLREFRTSQLNIFAKRGRKSRDTVTIIISPPPYVYCTVSSSICMCKKAYIYIEMPADIETLNQEKNTLWILKYSQIKCVILV